MSVVLPMALPAIGSIDRQADLQILTEIEDVRTDRGGVGPCIFPISVLDV